MMRLRWLKKLFLIIKKHFCRINWFFFFKFTRLKWFVKYSEQPFIKPDTTYFESKPKLVYEIELVALYILFCTEYNSGMIINFFLFEIWTVAFIMDVIIEFNFNGEVIFCASDNSISIACISIRVKSNPISFETVFLICSK
jgi:hypothetical protein